MSPGETGGPSPEELGVEVKVSRPGSREGAETDESTLAGIESVFSGVQAELMQAGTTLDVVGVIRKLEHLYDKVYKVGSQQATLPQKEALGTRIHTFLIGQAWKKYDGIEHHK